MERGHGSNVSLRVWVRASNAVDADLRVYLERASAAHQPRDAVHLRHQELVARTAQPGSWQPMAEQGLGGAGVADLLLGRPGELALVEVWDWFADVGDAFRSWDRKLERLAARDDEQVSGCWAVRATRRNRALIRTHATLFTARFPGSGTAWLAAFADPQQPMPGQPALVWVSVSDDRLIAARGRATRP